METLDTPETPIAETSMEAAFMEAAAKLDRGEQAESPIPETQSVDTEENVPTDAELADPANKDRARDPVSGKFIKREEGESDAPSEAVDASKTAPEATAVSDYEKKKQEKAAKEEERKNRSWENLNREKDELARRRQELAQIEQQVRQPQRQAPQPREYSSKQFFEASQDFKATAKSAFKRYQETGNEADLDAFNQNDQWAEQAQQNAIEFYALEEKENQQAAMQQQRGVWVRNMETVIKADPELAKSDSPISMQLQGLLKTDGAILQMIPNGFAKAVEIARLRLDAKETPTLREENKKLKAEVDRLNGKLAPTPGGVTTAPSKKKFEDMTSVEQEQFLERASQGQ